MYKPCLNGGICHDLINGFQCNCTNNYMGAYCQLLFDACTKHPNPCLNNGTCLHITSSLNDYYYKCSPGFEGKNCEVNINECLMGTCPIGKVCIDGINTYDCKCPEGYTGENC
uniref:Fibropellin-1 n=1 Tax=Schizaphis graminum TaxID=13262 RepID=A0A2S2PSX5_SCHGA